MERDILSELREGLNSDYIWDSYDSFCSQLPGSDVTDVELFEIIPEIKKKLQGDGAIRDIHLAVLNYAKIDKTRSLSLFDLFSNSSNEVHHEFIPELSDAIADTHGLMVSFQKLEITIQKDHLAMSSLDALYRLDTNSLNRVDRMDISRRLEDRFEEICNNGDVKLKSYVLRCYARFMDVMDDAESKILELAQLRDPNIHIGIYDVLNSKIFDKNSQIYRRLFLQLVFIDKTYTVLIRYLELDLIKLFEENSDLAEDFISEWIIAKQESDGSDITCFEHLFSKLYETNEKIFSRVITDWLNHESRVFHRACRSLMNKFYIRRIYEVQLSCERLSNLDAHDIRYIASKVMGYVYGHHQLRSMLYSMLKCNEDRNVHNMLFSAFTEYVMLNYPSTKDYLLEKHKTASPMVQETIDLIIESTDQYFNSIRELPKLKELNGSTRFAREYKKLESKTYQEGSKKAQAGSFASMFKRINLKDTNTWFHRSEEGYSSKSILGSVSVSAELPRGEFIDQYGMSLARLYWTMEKKG